MKNQELYNYILEIADNSLILGQRMGELCGHGPSLETDIACTNISLDLFGQVRSYFQYAASLTEGETEDDIAFLRKEREYKNVLLAEQPNTNFAYTIVRQFFFDIYHVLFVEELQNSNDVTLAAIAKKTIKEASYHKRFSGDWVIRLGDGSEESHNKIQEAVDYLWPYVEELFMLTDTAKKMIAEGIGVNTDNFKETYYNSVKEVLAEATIMLPENKWFHKGGKQGIHSEHLGYLLADMQYMQRTYPNMEW